MMQEDDRQDETVEETETAPEFSDDAPGFDMLADADADNPTPDNPKPDNLTPDTPSQNDADNNAGDAADHDDAPHHDTHHDQADRASAKTHGRQKTASDESYKVLARKYRPRNFDDLIGQEAMVQTLSNAFDSGRIAHAFMLTGVRGVGKTTTARILARALNYHRGDGDAPSMALGEDGTHCAAIMDGTHVDVIEMDAASRTGIGDIREIIENVRYAPAAARFKVYIIDEVHMLSKAAFNGLLKTLEEPPAHVKFIFATTEIRQVPVTVLSRCQRFDLRRLGLNDTQKLLEKVCAAEDVTLPEEALKLIARAADGSARDGLSLLDRALAHSGGAHSGDSSDGDTPIDENVMRALLGLADRARIFDLFDLVMRGELRAALDEFDAQYAMGADPAVILADLAELTHWLTRLKFVPAAQDDVAFSAELRQRGQAAAEQLSTRVLSRLWQGLLSGHEEVNRAMNAKAAGEMVLIRLAHLVDAPTPDELIKKFDTAAPPASSPSPSPASSSSVSSSGHSPNAQMAVSAEPQSVGTGFASGAPPRAMAQAAPVVQAHVPVLQSFQAVIDLAADKRDIGLKHALENGVHLVSFETAAADRAGRIELRLAEGQDNMAQDLTRKLRDWTGQNWVVSLSQEKGAATLGSLKRTAAEQREDAARQDPHVQAALAAFPGAEILSVNDFSDAFDAISNDDMPNDDISNDADRDADEG